MSCRPCLTISSLEGDGFEGKGGCSIGSGAGKGERLDGIEGDCGGGEGGGGDGSLGGGGNGTETTR